MARLIWTLPARDDLREIRRFIARDSRDRARAMVERIQNAAVRLEAFPQLGRSVPEYDDTSYREIQVPPYRILYRHLAEIDAVEILSVMHGHRMLPPLREDG
jgi:toxin ParE1/3/4